MAEGEGIQIHAVAANNDFSCPASEVREAQIAYLRDLIRMTAVCHSMSFDTSGPIGGF